MVVISRNGKEVAIGDEEFAELMHVLDQSPFQNWYPSAFNLLDKIWLALTEDMIAQEKFSK